MPTRFISDHTVTLPRPSSRAMVQNVSVILLRVSSDISLFVAMVSSRKRGIADLFVTGAARDI
ncbi:MAG: hypothetical protein Q4Q58_03010 [Thermoplasmata archaeon]|nr:hypothetical protein [Thermoplasmata archaeon]